jgi:serine/threonine protein kinase
LHPNILRLYEVLDDPNVNKMYLVLEYVKKGDLINVLKKRAEEKNGSNNNNNNNSNNNSNDNNFTPLPDLEVWHIFRQLISGIRYLHFQNIVHGDIKPQVYNDSYITHILNHTYILFYLILSLYFI